ncbi:MAG: hypothetical protein Q9179_004645 [Wetmoreana sp. 5 TL-2023]
MLQFKGGDPAITRYFLNTKDFSNLISSVLSLFKAETQDLPEITLDTTLAELYDKGNPTCGKERLALLPCNANSEIAPTSKLGRNTKYLYQDFTFSTTPLHVSSDQQEEIRRMVAVKYLSLLPQHDTFVAGNMPVIFLNPDPDASATASNHSRKEAERTMSSLGTVQRPKLLCYDNPEQISLKASGINVLAPKNVLDGLEGLPMVVGLETHYFLKSKAALCTSGLPSPNAKLLELKDYSIDPGSCCSVCRSCPGSLCIPSDCTGSRRPWLREQVTRTISQISSQPLPFVLKNQQTYAGGGTFVVSSQEDLKELQSTLSTQTLPKLFSQVNSCNAHLKPATLIMSEMITNIIGDWGLTFFVTRAGECIFLALTQQMVDPKKAYIGSTISYTAQDSLKERFTPIMRKIGAWLSSYGYYGPCGADILESVPQHGQSSGASEFNIVDLNVRTTGSLAVAVLRGHFSEQRGLHEASAFAVSVEMTRDAFIRAFARQFREGRIVIVAWYEDRASGVSYGKLVIGARDKEALEEEVARVKKVVSEVHF